MRVGVVRLVALRELRERSRSRVFRITTLLSILAVAAGVVVPTLQRDSHKTYVVVVSEAATPGLEEVVRSTAVQVGIDVEVTQSAAGQVADDIRTGVADVAILDGTLLVREAITRGDTSQRARFVTTLSFGVALHQALTNAGVPATAAGTVLRQPAVPIASLEPEKVDPKGRATAVFGIILLFFQLIQYSSWVLYGVVEEKTSRVVEVLLCTLRPVELLTGKVIGIGILALGHSVLLLGIGLVSALLTGSDVLNATSASTALAVVGWFLLGYALSCTLNAAGGSLVSRQEEAQSVTAPVMVPMLIGYLAGIAAVSSGEASTIVRVLAFIPPTAPFTMPALMAIGAVEPWEVALSVVFMIIATIAVARVAATIYERSILNTGQRLRWRQALRGSPA